MKVIICVKQVPNPDQVKINQETGTLVRDQIPSIINPEDKNALEEALKFKEQYGAYLIALSMGPLQAKEVLKETLAMGVDEGILLSDQAFAGSDTWATATILSSAIEKVGGYDLIFCGQQTIDGSTAQVGPKIAEFLNIPLITYVREITVKENCLEVTRFTEYGEYIFNVPIPVLLATTKELNSPRQPTMKSIMEAYSKKSEEKIQIWGIHDISINSNQIGIEGSPTRIAKSFLPTINADVEIIEGKNVKDQAKTLITKLSKLNII